PADRLPPAGNTEQGGAWARGVLPGLPEHRVRPLRGVSRGRRERPGGRGQWHVHGVPPPCARARWRGRGATTVSVLGDAVRAAREAGNISALVETIPYLRFFGISADTGSGELIGKLAYSEPLIGNASLPALHGGAIGGLLESTAILQALWELDTNALPKIVTI